MILMILQAIEPLQPPMFTDVTFRTMDVLLIIGWVAGLISVYFYLKYRVQRLGEILADHIERFEDENDNIHSRIDNTRERHTDLEKDLVKKHDELRNHMQQMELRIIEKISEIKNKN